MLEECRVILPDKPDRVALMDFASELNKHFGGYTRYEAYGTWRNPYTKKLVMERVRIYDVAIPPNEFSRLRKIALDTARHMRETSVYLRRGTGDVYILETKDHSYDGNTGKLEGS